VEHPHDVSLSRLAARLASEGRTEPEARGVWQQVADRSQDPADPFTAADWRRHWRGAAKFAPPHFGPEVQVWAQGTAGRPPGTSGEKAEAAMNSQPGGEPIGITQQALGGEPDDEVTERGLRRRMPRSGMCRTSRVRS